VDGSAVLHVDRPADEIRASASTIAIPKPGVCLHASVSLLIHLETVLSGRRGRVDHDRGLTLAGNLHLPELRAEIAFRNHGGNGNGSGHVEEHRASATIVSHHFTMPIPLQHVAPPGHEESDIWMLTPGTDPDSTWVEHYAGQLQEEPLTFDRHIPVEATLDVTFTPEESQNGRGTRVDVAGELRFERSTRMRLRFRAPEQSKAPSLESEGDEVALIAAGSRIAIPRQTVSSLAGRDSWMTVRVVDAERRVICVEQRLTGPARNAA